MENSNIRILLAMFSFSFILLSPAMAICVPRSATLGPSPSPNSPLNSDASSSQKPSLSPESAPPPHSTATTPQSLQVEPPLSPNSPLDSNTSPYQKPSPSPESILPPAPTAAPPQSSQAADADPPSTPVAATTILGGNPIQAGLANLALKKVCDTTDYPDICVSTLAPFLAGNVLLAEPIGLLQAAIKAATAETKLAMTVLARLIETSNADAKTLMSLKDCHDNYSDALDNFEAAMDAIPNRDIGTINSMLSAVVTDYGTCDDGFTGGNSPMAGQGSKLSHMADNCLAIASLIN